MIFLPGVERVLSVKLPYVFNHVEVGIYVIPSHLTAFASECDGFTKAYLVLARLLANPLPRLTATIVTRVLAPLDRC